MNEIPNLTDILNFENFYEILFIKIFYRTALTMSIEQENVEITKLLLDHPEIDVNKKSVLNQFFFVYVISNQFFF
mgnify:CR=1 FL=1